MLIDASPASGAGPRDLGRPYVDRLLRARMAYVQRNILDAYGRVRDIAITRRK